MSAKLRHIGRDLQSRLKEFFETPIDSDATPLELLQSALDLLEEIVEPGVLDPSQIHTPGIYVDRLIQGSFEKRVEKRTTRAA